MRQDDDATYVGGFDKPTTGKILLNGEDISALPPHRRPVNTVFQRYALFPHLNVYDNVAFGLKLKRLKVTYEKEDGKRFTKTEKLSVRKSPKRWAGRSK